VRRFVYIWPALIGALFAALGLPQALALEGGRVAAARQFGIVGTIAASRSQIGRGFPAVQIAPSWVLTAAHVAPSSGAIFANAYGIAGISAVMTFPTKAPTVSPIPGAPRDDLALVHLAKAIQGPYFPRLADEGLLPRAPFAAGAATLVSNNPSLNRRRYGFATVEVPAPAIGYSLAMCTAGADADGAYLVQGDSGSPLFLGRIHDADDSTILAGIASGRLIDPSGAHLSIYTRVGPYRQLLDKAVEGSGEKIRWTHEIEEVKQ